MSKDLLLLLLLSGVVQAKNLGTWGEMYPIAEQDMLTTIQTRLKAMEASGEMAREQDAFRQRVMENTLRPKPVEGLTLAQKNTTHYIDPSLTISEDLKDQQGRVFARKGQVINPLDTVAFTDTLYFIDADNPQQLAWIKAQKPETLTARVILVNGDIREATNALDTRIYFDQDGTLSRKFALTAIPARVTLSEDRRRLRIDTFVVPGSGESHE
ncbi:type-F conjugative transfer system protein TraW [Kosakonia sp. R1.Fl]|uniref:type-F conjugative transfer system protein TraW n=1 Tax=Kosakonia sp. R1.Fl TaxID=2928706 RepID=UPI00201E169C|nr:type-F conjugative transfer system protein TraW [Kosakonia sp. R1.Fl]